MDVSCGRGISLGVYVSIGGSFANTKTKVSTNSDVLCLDWGMLRKVVDIKVGNTTLGD